MNDPLHWCPNIKGISETADHCDCFRLVECPRCRASDQWTERQLTSGQCPCFYCGTDVASLAVALKYDALMYWDFIWGKIKEFIRAR